MKRFASWGYELDYDAEIARDLHDLEVLERVRPVCALVSAEEEAKSFAIGVWAFLHQKQAESVLGVTVYDMECFAAVFMNCDWSSLGAGWYSHGERVDEWLAAFMGATGAGSTAVFTEPKRKRLVALVKSRLARHRRNGAR